MTTAISIKTTKVFDAILQAWKDGKKGILLEGGTYSSKTYSALEALVVIAQEAPHPIDINIVSETVPHLKGGCIRDWFRIIDENMETSPFYNKSDHIYRRPGWNGLITFLSADNQKALGMRREVLFINEGDTLGWETARELISRTDVFVIIDWNPRSEFWAHEYYLNVEGGEPVEDKPYLIDPKWAYDHSTYLDALDVIPANKRDEILSLGEKDPNYQNVYVLGLLGKIEGLVYPKFEQVDGLPEGNYFYGLDYGFSSDPTVLVKNVIIGDKLYSQEMFYDRSGLVNEDIAREMKLCQVKASELVWADRDELKSAVELCRLGFNVQPVDKAYYGRAYRIRQVNTYFQYWTKDSLNCIKEQKNYRFIEDKGHPGWFTDRMTHLWSHGMTAREFGVVMYLPGYDGVEPAAVSYM